MDMNEVVDFGKTIVGGADGPTSVFLAFRLSPAFLAATIIMGLLVAFFGLKLVRVLMTLIGFAAGLGAGLSIAAAAGTDEIVSAVIVLACALVLAALSFFIYRFGVFCTAFAGSISAVGAVAANIGVWIPPVILLVICVVIGILAAIFVEPVIIVVTAFYGGITAGLSIAGAAGLSGFAWAGYAIGAALAIAGAGVQFAMNSKKNGKKERTNAEEIKGKSSVESEVERARMVLDDEDEEE